MPNEKDRIQVKNKLVEAVQEYAALELNIDVPTSKDFTLKMGYPTTEFKNDISEQVISVQVDISRKYL